MNSHKKVPIDSFSSLANSKKINNNSISSNSSIEDDDDESEDSDDGLGSNDDESNNMMRENSYSSPNKNRYASSDSSSEGSDNSYGSTADDSDEDEDMMSNGSGMGGSHRSMSSGESDNSSSMTGSYEDDDEESAPKMSYEDIQREKQKILLDLDRLQGQGFPPSKKYTMASNYEDMKYERDKLKKQRDVEKSIKFSRKALMMVVSGIEFANGRWDPFDVKLEGWSENVMENINDYDEVFEELHDKYGESVKMAPELRLLMMVAGSGFMTHMTNTLFK
jgi:hypothetical protein